MIDELNHNLTRGISRDRRDAEEVELILEPIMHSPHNMRLMVIQENDKFC